MPISLSKTEKSCEIQRPVVLHVRVVSGTGGGPEKTILNSPRFLKDLGFDAHCAYMRAPKDKGFESIANRANQLHAPLITVDDRGPMDVRVISHLLNVCRQHRVAIWHGHDYKSNAIGVLLKRFWKMKLISTVHGWVKFTRRTPLYYGIDRLSLRAYDHVVCVSEDLRQRCLKAGVREHRCQVIENAIDYAQFQRTQSVAEAKNQLGIPESRLLLGAVGRLSTEKGFDHLIRSVDQLIRRGLDLNLVIVGEGDAQAELNTLIQKLGQEDRIQLLGYRSNMLPIYEAMDAFALSSVREGLPNVVLEALAMGIPILATEVAGLPGIITDAETGLLVPVGDQEKWIAKLDDLLNDADLRNRLGKAGQKMVQKEYSFQHRMEQMAEVYNQILGRNAMERDA